MSTVLTTLERQRHTLWAGMRATLDAAERQHRDLTVEEQRAWDQQNAELDALDARITGLRENERRSREIEDSMAQFVPAARSGVHGLSSEDRDLDTAFRAAVLQHDRRPIVVNPTERRSGFQPGIERRTLSTTSGSGMVPTSFYNRVVMHMVDSAAILAAGATVLQSDSGEPLKVPKTTAFSTAAIVTEGATISTSDPTLGTASLGAYKYGFLVQISHELAADATFDVVGFLATQAGIALGNAFGAHAITGTGSGQPTGLATAATTGVTGGSGVAGAFTADNLIDLYHSLAEPYARSASAAWLMRNATLGAVRKLKDSQNRYLFDINAPAGTGASGTLLGRPVYADPNVAAVGLSAKSVLFGAVDRYWVRFVEGLRFERSDEFAFSSDLVTFRALARLDGTLVDTTGAVKAYSGNAA